MSPSSAAAGVLGSATTSRRRPQPGADADQQLDQQRLLVREMPVDRGPADADRGADVLESHRQESAFGEQSFGCGDQLGAPVGLRPAAPGRSAPSPGRRAIAASGSAGRQFG